MILVMRAAPEPEVSQLSQPALRIGNRVIKLERVGGITPSACLRIHVPASPLVSAPDSPLKIYRNIPGSRALLRRFVSRSLHMHLQPVSLPIGVSRFETQGICWILVERSSQEVVGTEGLESGTSGD
jgi:hypothetical protein